MSGVAACTAAGAAAALLAAEASRAGRQRLTSEWPDLDLETAYRIQDEVLARRLKRGERLVGVKLGVTSCEGQQPKAAGSVATAWLTDAMALPADAPAPRQRLIRPRAQPEIAFVMGRRLEGPGVTAAAALAAVARVHAGVRAADS